MNQRQHQQQKQQQKQGYYMSQQHLKLMHIMHLSGYALQEYIANEIEMNPVLEMEKEGDVELKNNEEDDSFDSELVWDSEDESFEKNYKQTTSNEDYYEAPIVQYYSLQENLKAQIQMLNLSAELTEIIYYLIDELNDDGYLPTPLSEVTDDYEFCNGKIVLEEKIENALNTLQKCEPAGVGARDLRECLLLQLRRKKNSDHKIHKLSMRLLEEEYQAFVQRQYLKIKTALDISSEELEKCISYISKLSPKPVTEINKYELLKEQIIPDFEVTVEDHEIYVSLTSSEFVKLLVNTNYASKDMNIRNNTERKQVEDYYKNLVSDANSLVNALKERETTMINVMKVIVQMQPDFFKSGDIKELRPMILQDIAVSTGFDISTVSRITSNKHVQTPFGIFGLKNLFMRAIPSESVDSSPSTSIQVQELIQQIVKKENKAKPLSDTHIMQLLKKQEISIARRTVVKYRELAGVPNSTMRREQEMILNE
ncbi:MAG: RNA polymerase factor sigma-54 [Bacteroidota bacterium]|nr:RNA polymerase factor sigma-54 [Bacteroidota bacterium]